MSNIGLKWKSISLNRNLLLYSAGLGLFCISMLIVKIDKDFALRWPAFYLWLAALLALWEASSVHNYDVSIKRAQPYSMMAWYIVIIAVMTRFLFLSRYPFVSLGDSLRDGGLDAMKIVNGIQKNIFAYGRYESHGLIIPTVSSMFYKIYGNSDLTFKVPSAIIGIIDISLLYHLVLRSKDRIGAFFAAIFLIGMPLHLFYSRTEIVVIFSSILMTLLLISVYRYCTHKDLRSVISVGLLLGLCLNFHASIRAVVFITIPIMVVLIVSSRNYKNIIKSILIMLLFMLIGFGPRIFMSSINIVFHTRTITALKDTVTKENVPDKVNTSKLKDAINTYPRAFLGYFYENVNSHYTHKAPIMPFVFGIFLMIGLAFALLEGSAFWKICAVYALIIPFTNSAMTEAVNNDHRLAPLFPLSAAIAGYGVSTVAMRMKNRMAPAKYVLLAMLIIVSVVRVYDFFDKEYATPTKDNYRTTLMAHVVDTLKTEPSKEKICLMSSQSTIDFLRLAHNREYMNFMLPDTSIEYKVKDEDDILYVMDSCDGFTSVELIVRCEENIKYFCPLNKESIQFFIERTKRE